MADLEAKVKRYKAEVARARQVEAAAIALVEGLERPNFLMTHPLVANLKKALDD